MKSTLIKAVLWSAASPISVLLIHFFASSLVNLLTFALALVAILCPLRAIWYSKNKTVGKVGAALLWLNVAWYAFFWWLVFRSRELPDKIYSIPMR